MFYDGVMPNWRRGICILNDRLIGDRHEGRKVINDAVEAQMKENMKAPRHWPLCGEFTGDRWISHTKDQ